MRELALLPREPNWQLKERAPTTVRAQEQGVQVLRVLRGIVLLLQDMRVLQKLMVGLMGKVAAPLLEMTEVQLMMMMTTTIALQEAASHLIRLARVWKYWSLWTDGGTCRLIFPVCNQLNRYRSCLKLSYVTIF